GERCAARAAAALGVAAAFVAGLGALQAIRPGLLADPEPSWAPYRLALCLAVAAAAAAAGVASAGLLLFASRSPALTEPLQGWPFNAVVTGALAGAALCAGVLLRFVALGRVPEWLWIDDLSLIGPALRLQGRFSDFADAVRPVPFGVAKLYGTVGVLYLEGYRWALQAWGTTVFGVRFPSALAGAVSLATGGLLGRALLPRGGGAVAVLALSGLRWHLILSRWGWVMIVLVAIVDLATLVLLRARRRSSVWAALAAGVVAGLGAHVYLASWVAGAALCAFALWPVDKPGARFLLALSFAAGFAAAASPIFLFRQGRQASYFARASDHNLALEIARSRSPEPLAAVAADALAAPWWVPDPSPRQDLPGAARLGLLLGLPVAVALARSLLAPRAELSALLLSHAGAAFAATVASGQAGNPNGSRFAYLSTVTAVAAGAGALALLRLAPLGRRRAAALLAVGAIAVSGALGVRDALLVWPERPETFDGFHGGDTLIARAALRWERLASVAVEPGLGHSDVTIDAIRRYRLDPAGGSQTAAGPRGVRVAAASAAARAGERLVERIVAPGGKTIGVVFARRLSE
ncbi:MAG: hypothetical protein ACRD00_04925, partial [Thermoanaerobaculia bacterium]